MIRVQGREMVPVRRIIHSPRTLARLEEHCRKNEALYIDAEPIRYAKIGSDDRVESFSVYASTRDHVTVPRFITVFNRSKSNGRVTGHWLSDSYRIAI